MVDVLSNSTRGLHKTLRRYALKATISRIAGLMLDTRFQANILRLEVLAHVAVSACSGRDRPTYQDFSSWLNTRLGATEIASLEDDPEDVFVGNLDLPEGNRLVLHGIWEEGVFQARCLAQVMSNPRAPPPCVAAHRAISALLAISDEALQRAGRKRWESGPLTAKVRLPIDHSTEIQVKARHVLFSLADLARLEINVSDLEPFLFDLERRGQLARERVGHSLLERRPLLRFEDTLVLALPTAVTAAIRRYAAEISLEHGFISDLQTALVNAQTQILFDDVLRSFEPANSVIAIGLPNFSGGLEVRSWLLRPEEGRYVHVLLIADTLADINEGLDEPVRLTATQQDQLTRLIDQISDTLSAQDNFVNGATLMAIAGAGRGFIGALWDTRQDWSFCASRLSDLQLLCSESSDEISRFLVSVAQRDEMQRKGVTFLNINGDMNFYAALKESEFELVPADLPVPGGSIFLAHDHLKPLRLKTRRGVDPHVVPNGEGAYARVTRFTFDSYFGSLTNRPIYVSRGHLRLDELAGVVEADNAYLWITTSLRRKDAGGRMAYEIWSGALQLLDRLCLVGRVTPISDKPVFAVRLDLSEVDFELGSADDAGRTSTSEAIYEIDLTGDGRAVVRFSAGYARSFGTADNLGERILVNALYDVFSLVGASDVLAPSSAEAALEVALPTTGARFLHAFEPRSVVDWLLSTATDSPIFVHPSDVATESLGLTTELGCTGGTLVEGAEACNALLHGAVALLWGKLKARLVRFNRRDVVRAAVALHEAVISDRLHWANTAQALTSLYGATDDVVGTALEREGDRNRAAVAARTLIEMSICESPAAGRPLPKVELQRLLGLASLFIETATDSDAIQSGLSEGRLRTLENGGYDIDRAYQRDVMQPFVASYFRESFNGAAAAYGELYEDRRRVESVSVRDRFAAEFSEAIREEYGLSPTQMLDAVGECIDIATERRAAVVEITRDELLSRISETRGLPPATCDAFLATFGLFPRARWEVPPTGFVNKDLNPWRFRRRLSSTVRPLAVTGDSADALVVYGVGALRLGVTYLLERSELGQLPNSFFLTEAMKSYIGAAVDKRGHQFARDVAAKLASAGWSVRSEVQMSELLAPTSEADGDIDVLAWDSTGRVYALECKRLQMARTVAEVAEVCRKFRGDAKDELGKHLRRVSWVTRNPHTLKRITGYVPGPDNIIGRVVTSTHVPMKFIVSLPISPSDIGPVDALLADMGSVPSRPTTGLG